jgi:kynurenine 3-monooxygenase
MIDVSRRRSRPAAGEASAPAPEETRRLPVVIAGAGLAGSLLAIYLAREGYEVTVFERRPDMRKTEIEGGRSINLGLSARGIKALRHAGLADTMLDRAVVMEGRVVHAQDGSTAFHAYGKNRREVLHSIDRKELNRLLLDEAERCGARIEFEMRCVDLDKPSRCLTFRHEPSGKLETIGADLLIGADGAFSVVRPKLHDGEVGDWHQEWLHWGYKELSLPADADGRSRVKLDALHVWPRGNSLIVSHPNRDGSHTLTLFLPFEGERYSFATLQKPAQVKAMLEDQFPDLLPVVPDLVEQFFAHPTSKLVTIKTAPWHWRDWAVLVGDAVHAVYPFYGQGMNSALEDCMTLAELIRARGERDWGEVFREFQELRKVHTDTLAELSKDNFLELSQRLRSSSYILRKKADVLLNQLFPDLWIPLYTMVSHTTIPYADAVRRAKRQERILKGIGLGAAALLAGYLFFGRRKR